MNHVKITSSCLQGLSPLLLSNSSTACNLEMQRSTPKGIEELPEGTTTLTLMHKKEVIRYQQTEVFFMVVKGIDSVMTCGAALAQMPKGEKYFCQYSTMQHWAFQSITLFPFPNQRGHFYSVCLRMIVMTEMFTTCMGHYLGSRTQRVRFGQELSPSLPIT